MKSLAILSLLLVISVVSCAPKDNKEDRSNGKTTSPPADTFIELSELEGSWLVDSMSGGGKSVISTDSEGFINPEILQKSFGVGINQDKKAIAVMEINQSKLAIKLVENDGSERVIKSDEFSFEKGIFNILDSGTGKTKNQMAVQRNGEGFVLAERSWKIVLKRLTAGILERMKMPQTTRLPTEPKPIPSPKENVAQPAQPTELSKIADAIVQLHGSVYGQPITEKFNEKAAGLTMNPLPDFKEKLETTFNMQNVTYDSTAITLGHVLHQNSLQCYSGTTLYISGLLKTLPQEQWDKSQIVIIYTVINGFAHVLPGFVVNENDAFKLYGVEMTVEGKSLVDFGITTKIQTPVKVVDALSWAKIIISSDDQTRKRILADGAVKGTHNRYSIPYNDQMQMKQEAMDQKLSDVFAFGKKLPETKQPRAKTIDIQNYRWGSPQLITDGTMIDVAPPFKAPPWEKFISPTTKAASWEEAAAKCQEAGDGTNYRLVSSATASIEGLVKYILREELYLNEEVARKIYKDEEIYLLSLWAPSEKNKQYYELDPEKGTFRKAGYIDRVGHPIRVWCELH